MFGVLYRNLGGPGDQLFYFTQAEHFIPFTDDYYGPAYFFALRSVRTLLAVDWFSAGKVLAFVGFACFLLLCGALFGRVLGKRERRLALMLAPRDSVGLLDRVHQHGVTYLVITERHTLFAFPEMASLLEDVPRNVPAGLQRDTLITAPRRLAIYRVLRDDGGAIR